MNRRSTLPSCTVASQSRGLPTPAESAPQSSHSVARASSGRLIDHRKASHIAANSSGVAQRSVVRSRDGMETNMRRRGTGNR
ncbi:hypothetical protein QE400_001011 [Xanthomonas sacchari]|nr:hypothetical protein [Xanthomonas sacchari]